MINTTVGTMHPTLIDLPDRTRIEMIELLNSRLAESLDLGLQARHARWNVRGSLFIALHDLFGRLQRGLEHYGDLVVERVVQLGGMAQGTIRAIQQNSSLPVYRAAIEGIGARAVHRGARGILRDHETLDCNGNRNWRSRNGRHPDGGSRGVDKWLWLVDANSTRT